jgi:CRP/FNR family transcriptional regulator
MHNPTTKELKTIPFLAHLRAAELETLARAMEVRAFANRQIIFREGSPCSGLYIVKVGQVKLIQTRKDKEQLLAIVRAGEPLDLVPFLDNGPHSFSAQARGAATLYFMPPETARDLIWSTPALLAAVLNTVGARLRTLATLASDLVFKDVTARVCKILLDQAQAEGLPRRDGIPLKRTLSRQEFASLIGTAREVAWRSLKKLEDEGVIKIERNQITLLDVERLAATA